MRLLTARSPKSILRGSRIERFPTTVFGVLAGAEWRFRKTSRHTSGDIARESDLASLLDCSTIFFVTCKSSDDARKPA